MRRLRNGLVARNADGVLAAFDPDKMPDYSIFSDQIRTFLDNWENVRVYYQIAEINQTRCGNENCGTAQVQFEIEAEDVQGQLPPMHRSAQLQLSFARGNKGWRIVNLTPREFF